MDYDEIVEQWQKQRRAHHRICDNVKEYLIRGAMLLRAYDLALKETRYHLELPLADEELVKLLSSHCPRDIFPIVAMLARQKLFPWNAFWGGDTLSFTEDGYEANSHRIRDAITTEVIETDHIEPWEVAVYIEPHLPHDRRNGFDWQICISCANPPKPATKIFLKDLGEFCRHAVNHRLAQPLL